MGESLLVVRDGRTERGWTDKVLEAFKDITVSNIDEAERRGMNEYLVLALPNYAVGVVSWERFKEVLKYVPAANYEERMNESPKFADFVEAASMAPGSYLHIVVIGKGREDEGVIIDGILLPIQEGADDALWILLHSELAAPDEVQFVEVNGRQYIWLWWD